MTAPSTAGPRDPHVVIIYRLTKRHAHAELAEIPIQPPVGPFEGAEAAETWARKYVDHRVGYYQVMPLTDPAKVVPRRLKRQLIPPYQRG